MPDDLITQKEAATARGVSLNAVNKWVRRERVRKYTRFGRTLVSRAEVMAYRPEQSKPGPKPKRREVSG